MELVDAPAYVMLTLFAIVLSFWGRQLARFISSITFAAFLSYVTWIHTYSLWRSTALSLVFALIAIIVGLATGFLVFKLAVSMIFAYILAGFITHGNSSLFIVLFIVLSVVMYVLSKYLLPALFASTGSIMLFKALTTLGLDVLLTVVICVVVFTAGFYNQIRKT
ncbi:MAG: hypothetical protein QXD50_04900 [Desulfurococcaceae archaeon]